MTWQLHGEGGSIGQANGCFNATWGRGGYGHKRKFPWCIPPVLKKMPQPHASPQQVAEVQRWWSTEIEPYKALILGPHEAQLVEAMSPVDQWSYRKYRYDVHFYYKNVPPPPREMWQEGILDMHTPESQRWLLQKELAEMYEASSDEDH